jgi:hypothetical protein
MAAPTVTKKEIDAIMSMNPAEVRDTTKKKALRYKDSWLDLSKNLYRIKLLKDYTKWGFETFEDYVNKELDLVDREVRYWISNLKKYVLDLGIDEEKLKGKSWSKLSIVMPAVKTKKDAEEWIEKTETHTQEQLKHKVSNKLAGKPEDSGPVMDTLRFSVTEDEKKTINKALEAAARVSQGNNDRPGHLLEMVCLDFLGDNPDNRKEFYASMIAKLERVFGVKLLAIDKENPKWKELFEQARDIVRGAQIES